MVCFYGCPGQKQAEAKIEEQKGIFNTCEIIATREVPKSLQKECADACIEAMKASHSQVNGGADDQDLEDVVEAIRYSMLAIYEKPATYIAFGHSREDAPNNKLLINITGLKKSEIDSVLTAYLQK